MNLEQVRDLKRAALMARPLFIAGVGSPEAKAAEEAWLAYYDHLLRLETQTMGKEQDEAK